MLARPGRLFPRRAAIRRTEDGRAGERIDVLGIRWAGGDRVEGVVLVDQCEAVRVVVRGVEAEVADGVDDIRPGEVNITHTALDIRYVVPVGTAVVASVETRRQAVEQKPSGVRGVANY